MTTIKGNRPSILHIMMNHKPVTIVVIMMVIASAGIIISNSNVSNMNQKFSDTITTTAKSFSTTNEPKVVVLPGEKKNGEKEFACTPARAIRPLKNRNEIGDLLQEYGLKTGIEVGVQRGLYAEILLKKWKSCTNYKLVDLWAHQKNYEDIANVSDEKQESLYQETQARLKPWAHKTEYYKMLSTEASKKIAEKEGQELVDFIYIDARHDYCGVTEDLVHYWPLLKAGGIMAGHDYRSNDEFEGQDWGLCHDGSRHESAVKGAVNDFFVPRGITVSVVYRESHDWNSWMAQKPMC